MLEQNSCILAADSHYVDLRIGISNRLLKHGRLHMHCPGQYGNIWSTHLASAVTMAPISLVAQRI